LLCFGCPFEKVVVDINIFIVAKVMIPKPDSSYSLELVGRIAKYRNYVNNRKEFLR